MTVDLPARLLADRLTLALAVASALAVEMTLARHPGLPPGPGLVAGGLLLLWQRRRLRRRARRVSFGPDGVAVHPDGGERWVCGTGPGARVVGRSVLLHWRDACGPGTAWLTPADVPAYALRAIRVRIQATRAAAAR
jgi:hypothetical protein